MKGSFWTSLICWIQPCYPRCHRTAGCGAFGKNISKFPIFKFPTFKIAPKPFQLLINQASTTIRTPWRVVFRPLWYAESSRAIHVATGPLVVAPLAKTSPKFPTFKIAPKPLQLLINQASTTLRTPWRVVSRPNWCAESSHGIHFSLTPLAAAL